MVNAARTLLLNVAQPTGIDERLGDQFIDPSFKPVRYGSAKVASLADSIRHAVFGTNPDRLTANYRAEQCMRALHADPVARPHVLALDPRVTYESNSTMFDFEPSMGLRVIDPDLVTATVVGSALGDEARGQFLRSFLVEPMVGGSLMFCRIKQISGGIYGVGDHTSRLLALVDPNINGVPLTIPQEPTATIKFTNVVLEGDPNRNGSGWLDITNLGPNHWAVEAFGETSFQYTPKYLVTSRAKPSGSLATIGRRLEDMQADGIDLDLPSGEPYATFRAMAQVGNHRIRRVCGVLLSLIYATHLAMEARS